MLIICIIFQVTALLETLEFLPSEEDYTLKQIRAFVRTRWLSAISSSDSQPLTTETAIFVKSHLYKLLFHFQEALQSLRELRKSRVPEKPGKPEVS